MSQKPLYAYVGTYTTENSKGNRNAHGVGIYVYEISRTNGRWKLVQEMPALNPAVLQFGKDQKYVYCVNRIGRNEKNVSELQKLKSAQ